MIFGISCKTSSTQPSQQDWILIFHPSIPTNPAVLKEERTRLVKTSCLVGDQWTVITGDQATYEAAVVIRDKYKDEFSNVVLLLGGCHQAHNYVKVFCKITRDSDAEDILVARCLGKS